MLKRRAGDTSTWGHMERLKQHKVSAQPLREQGSKTSMLKTPGERLRPNKERKLIKFEFSSSVDFLHRAGSLQPGD